MEFYNKETELVLVELQASAEGLTEQEVKARQERDGFNELKSKDKVPTWKILLDTFKDPMVIVLLIVTMVQLALGEVVEACIILGVVLISSIVTVIQTKKAESSLDALKQISAPHAKVARGGEKITIPARELVVGDLVLLEAGDFVPADGRILTCKSLRVEEGMLTGESEAVEKTDEALEGELPLGDRKNMLYSGALTVYGRGEFIVTGIGSQTEIGKIATLLETAEEKQTPLQLKLEKFSKQLGIAILILSVAIFAIQAARIFLAGDGANIEVKMLDAFMFAVAVAVAAIPEALSSIVTIVLSVGTNKMAKQHAIIRKLPAVETLGSTSVICTDKTGTLTQNKMTVVDYFLPGDKKESFPDQPEAWTNDEARLIQAAVLCNDSSINEDGQELGDPTEVALIAFSNKVGKPYKEVREAYPRLAELPFDSDRKLMSTINLIDDAKLMLTKGGPDVVFARCSKVLINGEVKEFTEELKAEFQKENEAFSNKALRVLAYAYKPLGQDKEVLDLEDENELILIGLTAMIDPPREAVYASIVEAKKAGIRTVMITGDHKTTARAIGQDIGLFGENDIAVTGQELDAMSEQELDDNLAKISVYARVSPENKIRIVRAWQKKAKVTAMTGDGVNDAPALKQANIGIAMGSGTDVAKDASSMILTDDNFVSIVNAVAVGRTVYENIKKSIGYLFSGNLGAIITIVFALIMNWASPFTALQLLFINLVNDSVPAIALGMEKAEPNVMNKKPRPSNEGIFEGGLMASVAVRGSLIGIAAIISQYIGMQVSNELGVAMAFTTLILARSLQTFTARSNSQTIISLGLFSNKYVLGAVAFCLGLYSLTTLPFTREFFSIPASFDMNHWLLAAGLALAAVIMMEIIKALRVLTSQKKAKVSIKKLG
ncbi:cation-translocating P-type ATPase [Lactococcus garvieae]|uniref:cation-translocating P-type ATPase n=1 Tax=Lactococcus garvieae TaxID=1363 RepID=UPI0018D5E8F2|nr:cation-translocating P-type ATPase [Lactococcus garvieae]QPS71607.1 cation-translocating P-type ATPase [Lactococcus garvieae]